MEYRPFFFLRSSMDHFWSIQFGLNFKKVIPDTIVCIIDLFFFLSLSFFFFWEAVWTISDQFGLG